jgi:hypothetical protein
MVATQGATWCGVGIAALVGVQRSETVKTNAPSPSVSGSAPVSTPRMRWPRANNHPSIPFLGLTPPGYNLSPPTGAMMTLFPLAEPYLNLSVSGTESAFWRSFHSQKLILQPE